MAPFTTSPLETRSPERFPLPPHRSSSRPAHPPRARTPGQRTPATTKGVAGGIFLILGTSQATALAAAEAAVAAIRSVPGILLPFPGGIVRSGSKVGSRYKKLRASTNDAYCPTLRGLVNSALPP